MVQCELDSNEANFAVRQRRYFLQSQEPQLEVVLETSALRGRNLWRRLLFVAVALQRLFCRTITLEGGRCETYFEFEEG
jgi:hypothetical protein